MNNWYVITGAPCSGKTTILNELKKRGYRVYYEMARIYIDQELKKGKTLKEIRKNEFDFQKKVLELKIDFEKKLARNKLLFLERGIPDSVAYMYLCGVEDKTYFKKTTNNCSYKKVFLLERVKYERDYARTESQKEAKLLEGLLEKSYLGCGIKTIKVPRLSITERTNFILSNL